jgi:hypothetical protein
MRFRRVVVFGIAGLACGWLAAMFASNPMVGWTPWRVPLLAALVSCVCCALAGAWVEGKPTMTSMDPLGRFAVAMLCAGASAGAIIGLVTGTMRGTSSSFALGASLSGAAIGALLSLPLMPGFALLKRATASMAEVRAGSLAAAGVARRSWRVLVGVATAASLAALPDWLAYGSGLREQPWESDLVAALLAVGLMALSALQANDLRKLRRVARQRETMEPYADDAARAVACGERVVDLGLGDDVAVRRACSDPYRAAERLTVVVHGSVARTRAHIGDTSRLALALVLIAATVGVHRLAATPEVALEFQRLRCVAGSPVGCYVAASMLEPGQLPDVRRPESVYLIQRACSLGLRLRACERPGKDPYDPCRGDRIWGTGSCVPPRGSL